MCIFSVHKGGGGFGNIPCDDETGSRIKEYVTMKRTAVAGSIVSAAALVLSVTNVLMPKVPNATWQETALGMFLGVISAAFVYKAVRDWRSASRSLRLITRAGNLKLYDLR